MVLEIYALQPFQIYDRGAIIDSVAVNALMDVYDIPNTKKADVLRRVLFYHHKLYPKLFGPQKKEKTKPGPKRR